MNNVSDTTFESENSAAPHSCLVPDSSIALICPVCNTPRHNNESTCHSCGFHYLETTQKFEPVVVNTVDVSQSAPKKHASLRVVRGPQNGHIFTLTREITSIGRSPQCDIFLNDMTVSREHAFIAFTEKGYVISDRNSYNGLWVNNISLEKKILECGDTIQIGAFCLVFES